MGSVAHVALAAVSIPSVGFLFWFLIALARDEKRERGRRLGFLRVARLSSKSVIGGSTAKVGRPVYQPAAADFGTTGRSFDRRATLARRPAQPQVCVVRLADKRAENTVKLRWLIMTLVLSAGVRANESPIQHAAGSPIPVLGITGPLTSALPMTLIQTAEPASWCA